MARVAGAAKATPSPTDSTMTAGDEKRELRYADILIRRGGTWAFQTMIQGGWGDNL